MGVHFRSFNKKLSTCLHVLSLPITSDSDLFKPSPVNIFHSDFVFLFFLDLLLNDKHYSLPLPVPDVPIVSVGFGASLDPSHIRECDDVYFECKVNSNPPAYKVTWQHEVKAKNIALYMVVTS